jgi:hypothetical protein
MHKIKWSLTGFQLFHIIEYLNEENYMLTLFRALIIIKDLKL